MPRFIWQAVSTVLEKSLPIGGPALLEKVRTLLRENSFDKVFLATEDAEIFRLFMESDIRDEILYVPQERIDYSREENTDKMLSDIYAQKERDGYVETLKYIGILTLLSERDALVSTVNCGAFKFAVGLNDHRYEFANVYTPNE